MTYVVTQDGIVCEDAAHAAALYKLLLDNTVERSAYYPDEAANPIKIDGLDEIPRIKPKPPNPKIFEDFLTKLIKAGKNGLNMREFLAEYDRKPMATSFLLLHLKKKTGVRSLTPYMRWTRSDPHNGTIYYSTYKTKRLLKALVKHG